MPGGLSNMVAPSELRPSLHQPVHTIETPVVFLDLETMERNITGYVDFADEHDVSLRSHVKTHKIPDIAHLQQEMSGGDGILCQTLSEAEVMAQSGIDDIYLSYMVVSESKLDRLVWLSEKLENFATTVDCRGNIEPLRQAAQKHGVVLNSILELDLGLNRVGASPDQAVELASLINNAPELEFDGIMAYEAHVTRDVESEPELERRCMEAMDEVQNTVESIESAGIPVNEVKVGSTSTSKFSGKHPVVTEINPGMYPFNDVIELNRRKFELEKDDCAATVDSTVISKPTPNRAVVDAGSKSISMDIDGLQPIPKDRDDISFQRASEEHGWIDTTGATDTIHVGDRIEFIVPHVCTTINLHDTVIGILNDRVEEIWEVAARGHVK